MHLVSFRDFLSLLSCLLSELNKVPCNMESSIQEESAIQHLVSYVVYYNSSLLYIYYTYVIHSHIINECVYVP